MTDVFTPEDVVRLRDIADYLDTPEVAATEDSWFVIDIADRIAALLPQTDAMTS